MKAKDLFFDKKLALIGILFVFAFASCKTDKSESANTWPAYKADEKSTSYSPLDQINLSNVKQLENAWTFQMNDLQQGQEPVSSQSNPIIVDGVQFR